MKRLVALMMCAVSLGAAAQVTYPYNPDGNADTLIGVTDLQDLLVVYGNPFLPQEVLVDGEPLSDVIGDLQTQIESMQLALGTTEYYWWQDLIWEAATDPNTTSWESIARFDPGTDGFLTVNMNCAGGNGFVIGVIPDSIEYADRYLLEAEFSESLTEGNYSRTIALSKSDCVVFSAMIEQIPQICPLQEPTISWTPITIEASGQPQETTCVFEYDFETPITIPTGCNHVVITPPTEVPFWEVTGYTSAGFTQLYNVPLASVLDTISSSGMYDVTEIVPYPTFTQVLLNTADVSELIVECGGEFRFVDLVLPSLLEFTIGLPGDDWVCDNGVLKLPQIQMVDEAGAIDLPRMRFLSQNQDYNTINGLSGSDGYWNSGDEQIGKYRKTIVGWFQIWGGI